MHFSRPQSPAGLISIVLALLFLVVVGLNLWTSGGEQHGGLVFATVLAGLGALAGVVFSIVAIVRQHERSLLVLLPLALGAAVVAFFAVEIVIGHD